MAMCVSVIDQRSQIEERVTCRFMTKKAVMLASSQHKINVFAIIVAVDLCPAILDFHALILRKLFVTNAFSAWAGGESCHHYIKEQNPYHKI